MPATKTRPAPIRVGEKVTQFPPETIQTVRAVEDDNGWAVQLYGDLDWYAADDLRPIRTVNYYYVESEGHMHLCVSCAFRRRQMGEDVEFLSGLDRDDRWDCEEPGCNAVQMERGFARHQKGY